MAMLPYTLPIELVEIVLDHLSPDSYRQDHRSDMHRWHRSCALVSKDFSILCQRRLFRYVRLLRPYHSNHHGIPVFIDPATRFYDLISESPHICDLVENLDLSEEFNVSSFSEVKLWIPSHTMLERILPKLERLNALELSGRRSYWLFFSDLREELQKAILNVCTSPNLVRLSLRYFGEFPLSIFSGPVSRIKEMQLFNVKFTGSPDPRFSAVPGPSARNEIVDQRHGRGRFYPTRLTIDADEIRGIVDAWTALVKFGLDPSQLKHLSLQTQPKSCELRSSACRDFRQLVESSLDACCGSLESLKIGLPMSVYPTLSENTVPDLQKMHSLRRLSIFPEVLRKEDDVERSMDYISRHMRSIPPISRYESISVPIVIEEPTLRRSLIGLPTSKWGSFANSVKGLAKSLHDAHESSQQGRECTLAIEVIVLKNDTIMDVETRLEKKLKECFKGARRYGLLLTVKMAKWEEIRVEYGW